MKTLFTLLCLLALVSCDLDDPKTGADGYKFEKSTIEVTEFKVKVFRYKSLEDLRTAGRSFGAKDPQLMAFANLYPPKFNQCDIHIVDPKYSYQPEWYGHELTHCMYGEWHK